MNGNMAAPETKPVLTREERRAKRELRRAKQREENAARAEKMHLARLAWEGKAKQLAVKQSPLPQFNVGCSGWFYWHWRGGFYPAFSWPTTSAVQYWRAGRRFTKRAQSSYGQILRIKGSISNGKCSANSGRRVPHFFSPIKSFSCISWLSITECQLGSLIGRQSL